MLHITHDPRSGAFGRVEARAWGDGGEWTLDNLELLLGAADDPSGFWPVHRVLQDAHRRHPHLRIGRTGLVFDSLLPAIIEQKVTGQEAFSGFRKLVRAYGEPAPAIGGAPRLILAPTPEVVAQVPSWQWLKFSIDRARSVAAVRSARVAPSLERLVADGAQLDRALRSLPGIGRWTSAEVRTRALGDPDAISFGDYHVAKDIGWALTGVPVDDDEMEVLLEPYRGHRGRVQRLVTAAGLHRPRRGPRVAPRRHLP